MYLLILSSLTGLPFVVQDLVFLMPLPAVGSAVEVVEPAQGVIPEAFESVRVLQPGGLGSAKEVIPGEPGLVVQALGGLPSLKAVVLRSLSHQDIWLADLV